MSTRTPVDTRTPYTVKSLAATLVLLLAIIGVCTFGSFMVAAPFGWLANAQDRLAAFLIGAIVGELSAFAVLAWRLQRRRVSLRSLGLGKATRWQGIVAALGVAAVYSGYTALNPAVGPHLLQFSALKLLAMLAALVAGLVEETIFRGYVMTALDAMQRKPVTQVVVSGVLFALAHAYGFASLPSLLVTFGATFALGAALAVVYLVGNRSLTPVIIGHALTDLVIEPWLLLGFFTGSM